MLQTDWTTPNYKNSAYMYNLFVISMYIYCVMYSIYTQSVSINKSGFIEWKIYIFIISSSSVYMKGYDEFMYPKCVLTMTLKNKKWLRSLYRQHGKRIEYNWSKNVDLVFILDDSIQKFIYRFGRYWLKMVYRLW